MKEKTIGQLLQFVRNNKNMRMKDVCEGICDSTTYSRYETGEYIPDMFTADFFLNVWKSIHQAYNMYHHMRRLKP